MSATASIGRRAENVARIRALLKEGMTSRQIAGETGLAYSTVRAYISDPEGTIEKARKDSYRGTCERCGARTDGSNGAAKAPRICNACQADELHSNRNWTRPRVIAAIKAFAAEHGRPPFAPEWNHKGKPATVPYVTEVQREFGTWNAAIKAAGFAPRPIGTYPRDEEWRRRMSEARRIWTVEMVEESMRRFLIINGRVPLQAEMRKRTNGWDGPSDATVYRRIGRPGIWAAAQLATILRAGV